MAKTTRLNDLQLVLLSHAAQSDNGNIHPLPEAAANDKQRTAKELSALLRRKLIAEVEVTDRSQSWRTDGDQSFGLVLTETGREALGLDAEEDEPDPAPPAKQDKAPSAPREGSKIAAVIALLQRKQGATLDEMVSATGWQPHTTRAALTGLKKKG
jgi:hypothetical protein